MWIYTAQIYAAFGSGVGEEYQRCWTWQCVFTESTNPQDLSNTKKIFTSLHTIQLNHVSCYLEIRKEALRWAQEMCAGFPITYLKLSTKDFLFWEALSYVSECVSSGQMSLPSRSHDILWCVREKQTENWSSFFLSSEGWQGHWRQEEGKALSPVKCSQRQKRLQMTW